ncbi:MAG TPA: DUF2760 domain-containing protein [Bryobacteraceae bacterium]|nr:DUF2760 domain-containing protein [Bryobacteraceae bacterium]
MNRISYSFRSFFSILFSGSLPPDIAQAFGYSKGLTVRATPAPAAPAPKAQSGPADGAVQILSILQRDARLVDFLMEDIAQYSDEQVGAAVRDVQQQSRESLARYLRLAPVIDGVEGTFTKTQGMDAAQLKFVGNVPASGKPSGGTLRHKGWKAEKVDLPAAPPGMVLAPAELEIE